MLLNARDRQPPHWTEQYPDDDGSTATRPRTVPVRLVALLAAAASAVLVLLMSRFDAL
jgi:hypothetical protein